MSDNELLLELSTMIDTKIRIKLEVIQSDIATIKDIVTNTKLDLENTTKPQNQHLIENYVQAARRYENAASQIEEMKADIGIMKKVLAEHSEN
ncbi:MAG: hypothetical protein LUH07_02685 [Lachnospiraceae bacterium]|nr:hypothetical protein [Lachnospiraceae bacterium]